MSRIYDAMKRAGQDRLVPVRAPERPARVTPPAPLTERAQNAYYHLLESVEQRVSGRCPVILVVGALPGEGASTVVRNLANTAGADGMRRVLLVDANLRNPQQHVAFGVSRSGGLSDLLADSTTSPELATTNGFHHGLALVTSGRPTENPAQVLTASRFRDALEPLRAKFDWIFVDGPPATLYPEAGALARMADGVILVVRAEKTRKEVAAEAKRRLEHAGGQILGAVLNRRRYYIPGFVYRLIFGGTSG